jgi:hypothetical protein
MYLTVIFIPRFENSFNDMLQGNFYNSENLSLIRLIYEVLVAILRTYSNISFWNIASRFISLRWHEYNFVHNYRSDRLGGGVGLYLSSDLQYKFRNDLGFPEQSCACWIIVYRNS